MRNIFFAISLGFAGCCCISSTAFTDSVTSYQYDALGRLISVTYPDGGGVTYGYDAAGNRTQVVRVAGASSTTKVVVLPLLGDVVIPVP